MTAPIRTGGFETTAYCNYAVRLHLQRAVLFVPCNASNRLHTILQVATHSTKHL